MFEDGAKLDDIMNIFKPPTLDEDKDKKKERVSEAGLRITTKSDFGSENIQYDFARQMNSGELR